MTDRLWHRVGRDVTPLLHNVTCINVTDFFTSRSVLYASTFNGSEDISSSLQTITLVSAFIIIILVILDTLLDTPVVVYLDISDLQ
jgi:hypothetical protein